jgi:hypothetical protein
MAKANIRNMVVGLKTFVTANLPAQLRLIELELADGIKLPDPQVHFVGFRNLFTDTFLFPRICYVCDALNPDIGGPMVDWTNPDVDILVSFTHSNPDTLEEILLRYSDAFNNLIISDRTIGGVSILSYLTAMDWGHPGGDDKGHAALFMTLRMEREIRP